MGNLSANFDEKEFLCRCCGEGAGQMYVSIIQICQVLRDVIERPIRITSGYRCYKRNRDAGGVPDSYHLSGQAADLSSDLGAAALWTAARALYRCGMIPDLKYCIWYKMRDIVHIDVGDRRPREHIFVTHL